MKIYDKKPWTKEEIKLVLKDLRDLIIMISFSLFVAKLVEVLIKLIIK